MGTSTSLAQFTGKLNKLSDELGDTGKPLRVTALRGKQIFIASAPGAIGSKPQGKRKVINARFDMKGDDRAIVYYTGPIHLISNPTKPHLILPRRRPGVRTRRRGARALTINGDVRASANHPGTRGKHYGERAIATCERVLPRVYANEQLTGPLRRIF